MEAIQENGRGKGLHALSFDIEDWFHIVGIRAAADPASWPRFPTIVERRTHEILVLVKQCGVRATFFVLGWVAERYPSLVRMIADEGHEIGTHSFWHRKVYELTPETFHEDLLDSIDILEQQSGIKVRGFRAPSFSIVRGTEWAFDIMKKVGLEYDASLFPAWRAHGGFCCELGPHMAQYGEGRAIPELPMSVAGWGRLRFCFSGGGYFRLLPGWLIEHGIRRLERERRPSVIYLHPRDIATDCPKMPLPLYRRFKCYVGRGSTERKLRRLLAKYQFTTCHDVLRQYSLLPEEQRLAELS